MITIATVWLWWQASTRFPQFFEGSHLFLMIGASYGFYALGGVVAAFLVLNKTGNRQAITGLKVGAICFIVSALYYTLYLGFERAPLIPMLFSFPLGGIIGAFLRIKLDSWRGESLKRDADAGTV